MLPDSNFCAVIYGGVENAEMIKVKAAIPSVPVAVPPAQPGNGQVAKDAAIAEIDNLIRLLVVRRAEIEHG